MSAHTCATKCAWNVGYTYMPMGASFILLFSPSSFWGCTSGGIMYIVFTCMPGERYHRSLLCLRDVFQIQALINSLVG